MPAAMACKHMCCWNLSSRVNLTPPWVGAGVMKKRPALKSVSFHIVMNLVSGIPKTSARNCGIYSMAVNTMVSIFAYFQYPIGQSSMCGNTWPRKRCRCLPCTSPTSVPCWSAMAYYWRTAISYLKNRKKCPSPNWFAAAPSAT